jgi:hypothetical protein
LVVAATVIPNSLEQQDNLVKSSCLATKLIIDSQEKLREPYIEFLNQATFPETPYLRPHPLLMEGEDFGNMNGLLRGSRTYRSIALRRKIYNYIADSLFGTGHRMTIEFKWAVGVVLSRALSSSEMPLTFVPVLDLCNHSFIGQNADHRYNKNAMEFSLVTTKVVKAGEELLINYGQGRDTPSFMSLYGFYDPDNKNDNITLNMKTKLKQIDSMNININQVQSNNKKQEILWQRTIADKFKVSITPVSLKDDGKNTVNIIEDFERPKYYDIGIYYRFH